MSEETKIEMLEFNRQPTPDEMDKALEQWRNGDRHPAKVDLVKKKL